MFLWFCIALVPAQGMLNENLYLSNFCRILQNISTYRPQEIGTFMYPYLPYGSSWHDSEDFSSWPPSQQAYFSLQAGSIFPRWTDILTAEANKYQYRYHNISNIGLNKKKLVSLGTHLKNMRYRRYVFFLYIDRRVPVPYWMDLKIYNSNLEDWLLTSTNQLISHFAINQSINLFYYSIF